MSHDQRALGVIGLGNRAAALIDAATRSGRFRVISATHGDGTAQSESAAEQRARELGAHVRSSTAEVLADAPDALLIAVPNDRHAATLAEIAPSGLPVLLEKPVAHTWEQTREVLRLADAGKPLVVIGTELRHAPSTARMRRIHSGKTPEILWAHEFREPFRPGISGWRNSHARTGGTFVEKNCHHFDLFALMADSRPIRVSAAHRRSGDAPAIGGAALVEFENGVIANLSVHLGQADHRLELGAVGTGWQFRYDSSDESVTWRIGEETGRESWDVADGATTGFDHPGEVEQWVAFANRLDGASAPDPSSFWGHAISFAAEIAADEHAIVSIDEEGELRW